MIKRILGILSYVGMLLVFGALAVRFVKPEWDQYAIYAAWSGLALVVLYTLGQWREIVDYFKQRNARYGAMASVGVLVFLGILVAVNYLSTRRNTRWDLTANKQYSLSDQTVKLLQGLKEPVKFLVFDMEANFERFRPRMDSYAYNSKQVQVEFIDADKSPVRTKQYNVDTYGTVVMEYMGRTERVTSDSEQDLTNALIKLLNPQMRKVYFLNGHGEKDPGSSDQRTGYSGIADALKRDNYQFDKLVLAQTNEIPADATMIAIAGPHTDLLEQEVPILEEYLSKKTGKLLVLLDPPDDFKQPASTPRLTALLKEWGIDATNSIVVDLSGRTQVATVPVGAPPYPAHAITQNFGLITMFPLVRAMTPAKDAPAGHTGQSFIQTAPRSWGETNFPTLEDPSKLAPEPEKGDVAGPVSIAVATAVPAPSTEKPDAKPASNTSDSADQGPKPETRVAAIGDSDFAANAYLGIEGNRDLFMNTVNWLSQQEGLIAIRPREASDRRITLTENLRVGMFWISIVFIPAIVLGAGVFSWWRRR